MGSVLGGVMREAMDENLRKNQLFINEMQKLQIERQIQIQNAVRARTTAAQIASGRDILCFLGPFYGLASTLLIVGYRRTKNPLVLAPVLSLTFLVAYQTDFVYGNKMQRIIGPFGKLWILVFSFLVLMAQAQKEGRDSVHNLPYGPRTRLIRDEAERIMENEASKLRIPGDVPTLGEVDQARIFHAERSATYSHDKENMQQFNDKSQRRFR